MLERRREFFHLFRVFVQFLLKLDNSAVFRVQLRQEVCVGALLGIFFELQGLYFGLKRLEVCPFAQFPDSLLQFYVFLPRRDQGLRGAVAFLLHLCRAGALVFMLILRFLG